MGLEARCDDVAVGSRRALTYGEGWELRGDRGLLDNVLGMSHASKHGGRDGGGDSVELHDGAVSPISLELGGKVVETESREGGRSETMCQLANSSARGSCTQE